MAMIGDYLWRRLKQWGVTRVFGYPGDGINGLMGALHRAEQDFDYVRVRHEEMSAFMAGAHAKFTGEVGVCIATSGPGAIHLLNGLYDAKMDHAPVLAIVGQQARSAIGADYQQEVDLANLFKDVASYVGTVMHPGQFRHCIDRAMRIAAAERTVTCLIVPNDMQELEAPDEQPREHGFVISGVGYAQPKPVPSAAELSAAADILNAGSKVAILVGAGALQATDELIEVADKLGAGVAKALLGKAALPDDLKFVTGAIGLLGTRPSWQMMEECDTLLMVGTCFPYSEFLPEEGQARAVQIDIQPRNLSMRYPADVNLVGDSAETLLRLLPLLRAKEDRSWQQRIQRNVADWWTELEQKAMVDADPINPQRVFWELSAQLPDDTILCGDSGSHTNWFARDVKIRRGMLASLSGTLATMGSGVPYAIAAKMAYPDRPVLAMVGDGAMQMNGNSELLTVQQYCQRWSNPCFVVMVLVNHDLNQVTWEQRVLAGDPKYREAQNVIDFPYARYAELLGFTGIRIDKPEQIAEGWRLAFAAKRPVVIEFVTDPEVPPLPPHITFEQARAYAKALIKNDPNRWRALKNSIKQLLRR
ncbi:MAG: thiamine pyrophosphate-requiring protein [Pseudomonadota bacterium]|nr:thiamine pyrophosphate-requiring protein [Pseudomonadota bacterium]